MGFLGDLFGGIKDFVGPVVGAVTGQPWLGSAISAGAGLISGKRAQEGQEATNAMNWNMMEQQQAFSADQAQKQMDFQEKLFNTNQQFVRDTNEWNRQFTYDMSNTAYQRATKDMISAGLNPMLAYSQGGASTPPGSSASGTSVPGGAMGQAGQANAMQNPKMQGIQAGLQSAQIAASVEKILADTRKVEAETNVVKAQEPLTRQQTLTQKEMENQLRTQAGLNDQQITNLNAQLSKIRAEIENIAARTEMTKEETKNVIAQLPNIVLQGGQIKATTANFAAQAALNNLEIPRAQNMANQQTSPWMKYISPYLGDLGRVTNSASSLGRIGR